MVFLAFIKLFYGKPLGNVLLILLFIDGSFRWRQLSLIQAENKRIKFL